MTLYAYSCRWTWRTRAGHRTYRSLLLGTPEDADVHLSIAHAQKTLGRRQEAIDSYRQAAACRPDFRRCLLESRQPQDLPLHG